MNTCLILSKESALTDMELREMIIGETVYDWVFVRNNLIKAGIPINIVDKSEIMDIELVLMTIGSFEDWQKIKKTVTALAGSTYTEPKNETDKDTDHDKIMRMKLE